MYKDTPESELAWCRKYATSAYTDAAFSFIRDKGYLATYKAMAERMRSIDAQLAAFPEAKANGSKGLQYAVERAQSTLENSAELFLAKADKMMQLGLPVDESLVAEAAEITTNA